MYMVEIIVTGKIISLVYASFEIIFHAFDR